MLQLFRGTMLEDRFCQLCKSQEIEVEIHFVCKYNLYEHTRKNIFRKGKQMCDDFELVT